MDIYREVRRQKPCKLLLVGEGIQSDELKARIAACEWAADIILIDRIPNDQIWKIYAAADYFVNLCRTEIFGMAILEAMYYEVSVAALVAPGPSVTLQDMPGHKLCRDYEDVKTGCWPSIRRERRSMRVRPERCSATTGNPVRMHFCHSLREKNNEDSGHNDILPRPREERSAAGHLCGSLHRTGVGEAGPSGDGAALLRTLFPELVKELGKHDFRRYGKIQECPNNEGVRVLLLEEQFWLRNAKWYLPVQQKKMAVAINQYFHEKEYETDVLLVHFPTNYVGIVERLDIHCKKAAVFHKTDLGTVLAKPEVCPTLRKTYDVLGARTSQLQKKLAKTGIRTTFLAQSGIDEDIIMTDEEFRKNGQRNRTPCGSSMREICFRTKMWTPS